MTTTIIANDSTLPPTTSASFSFDAGAFAARPEWARRGDAVVHFLRKAMCAWLTDRYAQARMRAELAYEPHRSSACPAGL